MYAFLLEAKMILKIAIFVISVGLFAVVLAPSLIANFMLLRNALNDRRNRPTAFHHR